jgi:hypothetical protein
VEGRAGGRRSIKTREKRERGGPPSKGRKDGRKSADLRSA